MLLSSYLDEAYLLGIAAEAPPTAQRSPYFLIIP
jgi:hypothetical protein